MNVYLLIPSLRFATLCGMPIADSQVTLWHRGDPLPLLPSGSDGVHGAALHRT